jgi:hypothetical protein
VDEESGGSLLNSGWRHGVPENDFGLQAHSGTQCWATNLKGEQVDLAISDLISPAIDLTQGNRATLSFWHYYDFQERSELLDIEAGQLELSTNNGASWTPLYAVSEEQSFDWEEVELDLSLFVGQVIRLRWNYQMFSFDPFPRPGWLLDDVTVRVSTEPTGVLVISNNLAQATCTVSGPVTRQVVGSLGRLTNAPPGTYTVQWSPVLFYQAPAAQTRQLAVGEPLVFAGTYTFTDANANGLSDAWESLYFGEVSSEHPPGMDSDGDGASDEQEFLAGTHPLRPTSVLALSEPRVQPNRTVRFEWPSALGREYRLEISNDLLTWQAASENVRGTGATLAATLPALDPRLPYYFRVRVVP